LWLLRAVEVWAAVVALEREDVAAVEARPQQDNLDRPGKQYRQHRLGRLRNVGKLQRHLQGKFLQCRLADKRLQHLPDKFRQRQVVDKRVRPPRRRLRHPHRALEPEA
jgi:hypothetical protein